MPNSHTAPLCAVSAHSRRGRSARRGSSKAGAAQCRLCRPHRGFPARPPAHRPTDRPSAGPLAAWRLPPASPAHRWLPMSPPSDRPYKTHHSPDRRAAASVSACPPVPGPIPPHRLPPPYMPLGAPPPAANPCGSAKTLPAPAAPYTPPRRSQRQAALPSQPDFLPQLCLVSVFADFFHP